MALEDALANFGAQNVQIASQGWMPDPKEARAKEAHQMQMNYRKSVMDKNKSDIEGAIREEDRKKMVANKLAYSTYMIGVANKVRAAKKNGATPDEQAAVGKEAIQGQLDNIYAVADDGEDEAIRQGLQSPNGQFLSTLDMIYQAQPSVQEHLFKMEEKSTGRGAYVIPKEIVVNGETVMVGWDARKSPEENMESIQGQIDSGATFTSPKTPSQKGAVKGATKTAEIEAETATTAKVDLPKVKSNSKYLKNIVRKLITHPAFEGMVGAPSIDKALQYWGGSKAAGFRALQNQLDGKQFSQAYETLKGGGQITEIEGQKATNALSRMKTSVSEQEYKDAAMEFLTEIDRLQEIAEQRASGKEIKGVITGKKAPRSAIDYLKNNNTPEMQEQFKDKYGYLP